MSARIAPSLAAMPRHCDTNSRERRPPPRQRSGVVADKRRSRSDALDAPAQRLCPLPPERDPANRRHRCTAAGSETSPLDHEFVSALPTASRAPCSSEFASGRRHLHGLRPRGVAQPDVRRAHAGAPSPLHECRRKDAARQSPQRRDAPPPQYLLILMTGRRATFPDRAPRAPPRYELNDAELPGSEQRAPTARSVHLPRAALDSPRCCTASDGDENPTAPLTGS
jgi:hypothetical protein